MRDDCDRKLFRADRCDCQTDPVDRDRSFIDHVAAEFRRDAYSQFPVAIGQGIEWKYLRSTVHMPLHDVPPQSVADGERTIEVYERPWHPRPQAGSGQAVPPKGR